jgi:ABC-type Co2+ transport system permease subunit
MHIADGILPAGISIGANAAAVAMVYIGSRNLKSEGIPKMGGLLILAITYIFTKFANQRNLHRDYK